MTYAKMAAMQRRRSSVGLALQAESDDTLCPQKLRSAQRQRRAISAQQQWSVRKLILVNFAVLHDDKKIISGLGQQFDICNRITIHEQQVRKCAFLDHT